MDDIYLLCRDCRVVHRLPVGLESSAGNPVGEEAAIAYGQFLVQHRHHPLERLTRTTLAEHHDGPLWDPMCTSFIELTNGRERFTVRASRTDIDQPLTREVVEGHRVSLESLHVTVEETVIRRALDHYFHPYALRQTKIDHFVAAVQDVLANLSGEQVETTFDDADDPAVSIARLPDDRCVALLAHCMDIFDAWELARVASFVSANRDEYGALALRVRREATPRPH
ncbi:MAG TPA: hypothetical protein VL403_05820 [Candidatus Kryptonia bacterium]|nr:hypothetical protein [Candidatus Kryptonia bacterium]